MKMITLLLTRISKTVMFWIFLLFLFCSVGLMAQQPSADLDQLRNGTPSNPIVNPQWINGNVGASNAHFVEGFSIPYRCVMENLPVPLPGGTPYVEIVFEFDIKHSSKH